MKTTKVYTLYLYKNESDELIRRAEFCTRLMDYDLLKQLLKTKAEEYNDKLTYTRENTRNVKTKFTNGLIANITIDYEWESEVLEDLKDEENYIRQYLNN